MTDQRLGWMMGAVVLLVTALPVLSAEQQNLLPNPDFETVVSDFSPPDGPWGPPGAVFKGWSKWLWGGDYDFVVGRGDYAQSGKASAGILCLGDAGRAGVFSDQLDAKGGTEYVLTAWVKGEGKNKTQLSMEGAINAKQEWTAGLEWKQVTIKGKAEKDGKFRVRFESSGTGAIYVDNMTLAAK